MANKFVCKDGNDANGGTSYADAKLTIASAITAASSGDTIQIGPGVYNEAVNVTAKTLTFQGDGYVIFDGGGTLGTGFLANNANIVVTVNDIIVRGFTTGMSATASSTVAPVLVANRCRVHNCTTGLQLNSTGTSNGAVTATNVLVHNCTTGATSTGNSNSGMTLSRCTIADCTTGAAKTNTHNFTVRHCVLANNGKHYNITGVSGTITINLNCVWFDGTANSTWNVTTTTDFATWKSTSGQDAASTSQDPVFFDREHKMYGLDRTSPIPLLLDDVSGGTGIGAGYKDQPVVGMSENDLAGNFANAIVTDCTLNASNNWEVASGSTEGTVRTPVMDLGRQATIQRLNIFTNLDKDRYPSNVPDYDTADVEPKAMTARYRHSSTSFVDADGSPSWVEFEPSALGETVTVVARYLQVEVTLRTDGT